MAPDYFLDKMAIDEVIAVMDARHKSQRDEWERTRLLAFYTIVAQRGNKEIKTPAHLFKLPWELADRNPGKLTREQMEERYKALKQ